MREKLLVRVMLVAALAICCHACTDKDEAVPSRPKAEEVSTNPHAISQEQALASLRDFLASFEDGETRSAMQGRQVKDIYPVAYHEDATRAANGDAVDCENLLYVVNFENEQGFAILAADDRVEDDVLAVVEEGSMSPQVMKAVANGGTLTTVRPIVSGFPLTGAYYIKATDDSDELCMNPNTVDLADTIKAEDGQSLDVDTLVGNFDPDSAHVTYPREFQSEISNDREPDFDLEGNYIGGLVYDKARNDLYDESKDNSRGDGSSEKPGNTAGSSQKKERTVVTSTPWSAYNTSSVLLRPYRLWGQDSPFNDLFPTRRKFLVGKKRRVGAGCFPLAIAKIFTLYRYPDFFTDNGVTVDWELLQTQSGVNSSNGKSSAAHLLCGISQGCGSLYFYHGTFTRPKKAMSYLRRNGFENVKSHDYDFGRVKAMIDKKYPVIIYACPRMNVFKSHCWNIDGYQIMRRTVTTRVYNTLNKVISESARQETRNVVHCDFGWNGAYNGYYSSGVFKLNDKDAKYDDLLLQEDPVKKTHYNSFKHIITYDIPNR